MMKEIIKVSNLSTAYSTLLNGRKKEVLIHDNISFSIKENSIFAILGGSGSGKSTLLRNMLLLNRPKSGDIEILGENIWKLALNKRGDILKQCGVMFQFGALFSSMSVGENIGIMLSENSKYSQSDIEEISKMWLKLVGLDEKVYDKNPSELSGGMTKRASLARALVLSPRILFLDEPTSGLDPYSAGKFDELILMLKDILGISIVMITHDLDSIKDAVDEFVLLQNKKIVFQGGLEDMSRQIQDGIITTELFSNKRGIRYIR